MAIAKATCTCERCGNTFTYRKECYNRDAAFSFEKWASENITVCPECRAKEKAEQIRRENAALPELTGSEKQIAWAIKIRLATVKEMKKRAESETPKRKALLENLLAHALENRTAAKWWIENRDELYVYSGFGKAWLEIKNELIKEKK